MIPVVSEAVFVGVLVLCRVGSCMMLLPGFGSQRIPMQFRALLAVAVSLTLLPMLYDLGAEAARQAGEPGRPLLLGGEILNGLTIGLLARLFMVALSFSATILTNIIGLAPTPGIPIDDTEPAPPLVNLISLTATMLVFATNLHHELIRSLIASYGALKISSPIDMGWYLDQILEQAGADVGACAPALRAFHCLCDYRESCDRLCQQVHPANLGLLRHHGNGRGRRFLPALLHD